jgi:hypothetical protein
LAEISGWLFAIPVPFLLMNAPGGAWIVLANILLGVNQDLCLAYLSGAIAAPYGLRPSLQSRTRLVEATTTVRITFQQIFRRALSPRM